MSNPYEKTITDIKHDYTTFLTNIMSPFIYEGIKSVYVFAIGGHKEFLERGKFDPDIKSPGIIKLFQLSLKEIPTLNNNTIEIETNRIKSGSKCASWFDQLVRATIKSHIVLLTFTNPQKIPNILKEKHHEKFEVKDFVHKCYIESARSIYNNPELFWHELPSSELKQNQLMILKLIKKSIEEAIRKTLPMELILNEYLNNDYLYFDENNDLHNNLPQSKYENIKSLLHKNKNKHHSSNSSSSSSTSEEDYMKYSSASSKSSRHSSYRTASGNSSSTESGTDYMANSSNSKASYSQSEEAEEHENTKNFLKDIESQLHVLDNTIKTVKEVKPSPIPPKPLPLPKPVKIDDNIFEKMRSESVKPKTPLASVHSEQKVIKQDTPQNIEQPVKVNSPPQQVPNVQHINFDQFNDPTAKPKRMTKKDKMFLEELENQINNNINK
jgi:hypothetical protein